MHSHERYYYNRLSQIFLNTSLPPLNLSIPIPLYISSSLFFILISLLSLSSSLSIFTPISLLSREKKGEGGREKENGSVWQIWYWRFAVEARLYGRGEGRKGVQACCGRNSVMNTYARVKW